MIPITLFPAPLLPRGTSGQQPLMSEIQLSPYPNCTSKGGYNSCMLPLPVSDPQWIETADELAQVITEIAVEPQIAVDTESNSLFVYRERVCLIQISTPSIDYLIDPLAIHDLSGLAHIFANPRQLKIFHAAEYDIICLKRDYGFEFAGIFDTMIAARILGELQVGLGSLLSSRFNIQLDKRFQRADWGKRPLSNVMLNYARMDTHYLFALKEHFEERLKQAGLWELALEDFSLVSTVQSNAAETNGNSCWKVSGGTRLDPKQSAILNALCRYRDQQAQKMDLPHFKVMSNQLLLDVAQAAPRTLAELKQLPGMSERLLHRHGTGLLAAVKAGEYEKPPRRQPRSKPDQAFMKRLDALREWRKVRGKELKVESDIILPRDIMESIACENPADSAALKQLMIRTPWRYRSYGVSILDTLHQLEEYENTL